jgi:hypothetical protein
MDRQAKKERLKKLYADQDSLLKIWRSIPLSQESLDIDKQLREIAVEIHQLWQEKALDNAGPLLGQTRKSRNS